MTHPDHIYKVPELSRDIINDRASEAEVTVGSYLSQALQLGFQLADIILADSEAECYIFISDDANNLTRYNLSFTPEFTPESPEMNAWEMEFLDPATRALEISLEDDLRVRDCAAILQTQPSHFIAISLFYRWLWGVAITQSGKIYIQDSQSTSEGLLEPELDIF